MHSYEHDPMTDDYLQANSLILEIARVLKDRDAQRTDNSDAARALRNAAALIGILSARLAEVQAEHLTFAELRAINKLRCETAFHSVDEWKPWEWSNAMAGECGEACNLTKKMNRIWPANQFKQNWNKPEDQRLDELSARVASEVADTVIYADLLLTSMGRSLGEAVRTTFNAKSDEIGSAVKFNEQREADRGEIVPACPQCHKHVRADYRTEKVCTGCGNKFTEPAYWQRMSKP